MEKAGETKREREERNKEESKSGDEMRAMGERAKETTGHRLLKSI